MTEDAKTLDAANAAKIKARLRAEIADRVGISSSREEDQADLAMTAINEIAGVSDAAETRVREILATIKPLAGEFYRLTGKPLGVTGEIAEYVAAEKLGLQLAVARTTGYDALRGSERIQIKGRAYGEDARPGQRMSRIKADSPCDTVLLVLLDNFTLDAREMWEAPFASVAKLLVLTESKARVRGQLSVSEFKTIAHRVWPEVV